MNSSPFILLLMFVLICNMLTNACLLSVGSLVCVQQASSLIIKRA